MAETRRSDRNVWLISLFLIMATTIVYWPVSRFDFVNYDDPNYVINNTMIQGKVSWGVVSWIFGTSYASNWHPVTWLSHLLDFKMFGLKPGGHHMVNLLFHVLNGVILFHVLRRMTKTVWRSAFVAAFFALHPLHVESVAWVSERKDVLSTLFLFLTLWAYVRYVEAAALSKPAFLWFILALVFFALGLMSKPMLVTLPFVLLMLDFWPLSRMAPASPAMRRAPSVSAKIVQPKARLNLILEKVPFFVLAAASSMATVWAQKRGGAISPWSELPFVPRLANALASYFLYLRKTFLPIDLAVSYPLSTSGGSLPQIVVAGVLLTGVSLLVVRCARSRPYLPVGWFWYLGTLFPVIGIVKVGSQAMADRYSYVPLIGIFVIACWGAAEWVGNSPVRKTRMALTGVTILFVCAILSSIQVGVWRNSGTLFTHAIKVNANNVVAYGNLGYFYRDQGKAQEALTCFRQAVQISPRNPVVYNNLAFFLKKQGQTNEALAVFNQALQIEPQNPDALQNVGIILFEQGKTDQAANWFFELLKVDPENFSAHVNLANAFTQQGRLEDAKTHYLAALKICPKDYNARFHLGYVLSSQGNFDSAIEQILEALQVNPNAVDARVYLSFVYFRKGKLDQAIECCRTVLNQDSNNAEALKYLAQYLQLKGSN